MIAIEFVITKLLDMFNKNSLSFLFRANEVQVISNLPLFSSNAGPPRYF